MSAPAIEAIDLVKTFDDFTAVDGVSFSVPVGTVFSMLGPNGAGKTTTVRMMTTLSIPTSGTARVAGFDVVAEPDAVRHRMGLTAQSATVDELLTGRENLRLIGDLYGLDRPLVKSSIEELLERFSLSEAGNKVVKDYSGGMRRRLDLAASLIATPPGALPRRADHRARPAQPGRALGRAARPRARRHHLVPHDPVPRRGRPAGRPHRRRRPRPDHRRGHPARAQGPVRGGQPGRHGEPARRGRRGGRDRAGPRSARSTSTATPGASPLPPRGSAPSPGSRPGSTRPASTSTTSACSGPASTTSSSTSPATGPRSSSESSHDEQITEAVR